jgi:hypothetical protein
MITFIFTTFPNRLSTTSLWFLNITNSTLILFFFYLRILGSPRFLSRRLFLYFLWLFCFLFWTRYHLFLHITSLFFHPPYFLFIPVFLFLQLVLHFLLLIYLLVFIKFCIAKTFVWMTICFVFLETQKRMITITIILQLSQLTFLLLYLSFNILQPLHRFRISQEILTIDICSNPLLMCMLIGLPMSWMSLHRRIKIIVMRSILVMLSLSHSWMNRHSLEQTNNFINTFCHSIKPFQI